MPGHTAPEKRKTAKKVSRKIQKLKKEGKKQSQATAIASESQPRNKKKRATFE